MTSVKPRSSTAPDLTGPSEFEILKRNHRFLRNEDGPSAQSASWDEALASKFYSNLWKEYALCDLKHYKSGNFALRWRTEEEVVSGAGETSCGNTRCKYHDVAGSSSMHKSKRALHTLELPFGYIEGGEAKSALVKVVLCDKCVKKIMWKREQAKKAASASAHSNSLTVEQQEKEPDNSATERDTRASRHGHGSKSDSGQNEPASHRHRHSRSLSPSRDPEKRQKRRR